VAETAPLPGRPAGSGTGEVVLTLEAKPHQVASLRCAAAVLVVLISMLSVAACQPATPTPQWANVQVTFDMGGGGSGFAASLFAQEVTSGKTFKGFYPAGSHGLVVMPTSAPILVTVEAPGTYVFFATLIEAPDDYQFGATECGAGAECTSTGLLAIDVEAGRTYAVTIADRSALIPTPGAPVAVPWHR